MKLDSPSPRPASALTLVLIGVSIFTACSPSEGPEAKLRALVSKAELAAEARDVGDFLGLVSSNFTGEGGLNKDGLGRALRAYFIVNQRVSVLTRIHEVRLEGQDLAHVEVTFAAARRPIEAGADLSEVRADIYRAELDLQLEDGEWRVIHARWQRGTPGDFL